MLAVSGRHPCLPVVHAAYEQKSPGGVRVVHVVTDAYFGGDLVEGVARRGAMTARDWETIAAQLLGAVHFLHAVGVVHRDVKPENVMLKRVGRRRGAARRARRFRIGGVRSRAGKENALRGFAGTKFSARRSVSAASARRRQERRVVSRRHAPRASRRDPPTRDVDSAWRALQDGSIPASMRPGDDTPTRLLELVGSCSSRIRARDRARPGARARRGSSARKCATETETKTP